MALTWLAMERVCVPGKLLTINDQYTKINPALGWLTKPLLPLLWRTQRVPTRTTAQTMDPTCQHEDPKHLCQLDSTSPILNLPEGRGSFLRSQVFYKLDWATECPETEFLFYFIFISVTLQNGMRWLERFITNFRQHLKFLFYSPHFNPVNSQNIGLTGI